MWTINSSNSRLCLNPLSKSYWVLLLFFGVSLVLYQYALDDGTQMQQEEEGYQELKGYVTTRSKLVMAAHAPPQEYDSSKPLLSVVLEPRDISLLHGIQSKNPYGDYVVVQIVNPASVEMTKNWICNIEQVAPKVLEYAVLIATDDQAKEELTQFIHHSKSKLAALLVLPFQPIPIKNYEPHDKKALDYFEFAAFRKGLLAKLVNEYSLSVFLIQPNAVWRKNALQVLQEQDQPVDLLSARGRLDKDKLQPGFQLHFATAQSKEFLNLLCEEMDRQLQRMRRDGIQALVSEQHLTKQMIRYISNCDGTAAVRPFAVKYIPSNVVASGEWYNFHNETERSERFGGDPAVIINNRLGGDKNTHIQRAKEFHHWFLQDNNLDCLVPSLT